MRRTPNLTFVSLAAVLVAAITGPTEANAAALSGQIIVDPDNPCWLVYNRDSDSDGKKDPFFLCGPGDPEGFLYRGTRNADGTRSGDQTTVINLLKDNGGNSSSSNRPISTRWRRTTSSRTEGRSGCWRTRARATSPTLRHSQEASV